jgi:hypothetical protein
MISRLGAMVGAFLNPDAPTEAFVEGFLNGREFERDVIFQQLGDQVVDGCEALLQEVE